MIFWICEADTWEHIMNNQCAEADARSMRDAVTAICALAERARAAGSSGCDHPKAGPH
jgi:hypothetical protein